MNDGAVENGCYVSTARTKQAQKATRMVANVFNYKRNSYQLTLFGEV